MKDNKILITGGGGFIGSNFTKYFSQKNQVVSIFFSKKLKKINKEIIYKKIDLRKKFKIDNNVKILIHCASITPARHTQQKCYKDNNKINKNLISAIKKSKIKKIVFLSSISVYDKKKLKILRENTQIKTNELYGKSKIDMENRLKKLSNKKLQIIILRLSSVVGNGSHGNFLSSIIKSLSSKQPKILFYNKNKFFNSCIHIKNLSVIINKMLKIQFSKSFIIFNICSSQPLKIFQIINLFVSSLKLKKLIHYSKEGRPHYLVRSTNLKKYNIKIKSTKSNILKYLRDLKSN